MFKTKKDHLIVYILALGIFGIINTELGIIAILPKISVSLGISITKAGTLVSIFALMVSLSGFFISTLFSKIDRKKTLLFAISMFILSNLISIFSHTYSFFLIARIIAGIFHPLFFGIALSYADSLVDEKYKGKVLAKVLLGLTLASLLGIPTSSYLAYLFTYKASFIFCLVFNCISFACIFFGIPAITYIAHISYSQHFKSLLKPVVIVNMLIEILAFACMFSVYSFISVYLLDVLHITPKILSLMLFCYGVGGILGNHYAGKLVGEKIINRMSYLILLYFVIYFLLYFIVPLQSVSFAIIFFLGFVQNMTPLFTLSWLIELGLKHNKELANAVSGSCANIGITVGTALAGAFITIFGIKYLIFTGTFFLLLLLIVKLYYKKIYAKFS